MPPMYFMRRASLDAKAVSAHRASSRGGQFRGGPAQYFGSSKKGFRIAMTQVGQDTLGARSTLTVGGKDYAYYALGKAAAAYGDVSRLPFSMKVLLENLLRFEDGGFTVSTDDIKALVDWQKDPASSREIQYRPARVLLQDFTGVPCVVDLAAMRDAIAKLGGDTSRINPQVPVHLVIDHSVMVDEFGHPKAFEQNVEIEYYRNGERYDFLKWGSKSLDSFKAGTPAWRVLIDVDALMPNQGVPRQGGVSTGDFLEGFDLAGEEGFEDWLREQRGLLAELGRQRLDRVANIVICGRFVIRRVACFHGLSPISMYAGQTQIGRAHV